MKTTLQEPNHEQSEDDAVIVRNLEDGTPIPDDVARRLDERAERIIERIRLTHGDIDTVQLVRDARAE